MEWIDWTKFVQIDVFALDKNWLEQPEKYMEVAEQAADARAEVDACKIYLENLQAALDNKIRRDPQMYGLDKITEGGVSTAIKRFKSYKKAQQSLLDAKKKSGKLDAVLSALDHRKKALENLVFLQGQNYFSKPRESKAVDQNVRNKARTHGTMKRKEGN